MPSTHLIILPYLFIVLSFYLVIHTSLKNIPSTLSKILIIAFIIRVILGITLNYLDLIPINLVNDAKDYHHDAKEIALNIVGEKHQLSLLRPGFGKETYSLILSIIYIIGGPFLFIGIIFSSILSHLTILNLYKFALINFNKITAVRTAMIISFLPSYLFFSFNTFREPLIIYLISVFMIDLGRFFNNYSINKIKMIITILFLLNLRFYLGFLLIAFTLGAILLKKSKLSLSLSVVSITIFLSIIIFLFGNATISIISNFLPIKISSLSISTIDIMRSAMMGGIAGGIGSGSSYMHNFELNTFIDLLKLIVFGTFNFTFGPLPTNAHNMSALLISFENIVILLFFIFGCKRIWKIKYQVYIILLIPVGIIISYGLIITDYGTALRMKQQAIPWLLTLPVFAFSYKALYYK